MQAFIVRLWQTREDDAATPLTLALRGVVQDVRSAHGRPFRDEQQLLHVLRSALATPAGEAPGSDDPDAADNRRRNS